MNVDPETHLRRLTTQALGQAHSRPHLPLLVRSSCVQATANAFVVLGLLPESTAEAILAEHKADLESMGFEVKGVKSGELTLRSGAHGYWQAREEERDGLSRVPLSTVASDLRCPTPSADVYIDWVTLTPGGLRMQVRAVNSEARAHPVGWLPHLKVIDDAGRSYSLSFDPLHDTGRYSDGEVIANPSVSDVTWIEIGPTDGGRSERINFRPSASVPVGRTDPPWPTPGECYLSWLIPETYYPEISIGFDLEGAAEVMATVADGLLAVGAIPPESALLRRESDQRVPDWQDLLPEKWMADHGDRNKGPMLGDHLGLAVHLPLEHATFVIDGLSVYERDVRLRTYAAPWVRGEYWPVAMRPFDIRVVDDRGNGHKVLMRTSGRPRGEHAGHDWIGNYALWPPVSDKARSIRVIVSTLWEAAWGEIELPGRA